MIITDFAVSGAVKNGNFAIGNTLIYEGLKKDPWYFSFVVKGAPKFLYYFTSDCIISTSEGVVKRFGEIDLLKVPFNKSCLFFMQDRDDKEFIYRCYLSYHGVKWLREVD
jgi:hypothetical protein